MSHRTLFPSTAVGRNAMLQSSPVALLSWPILHALSIFLLLLILPGTSASMPLERWETTSGMRVLFAPADTLPMLDIRLTFDAGAARDGDRPGLARLTSAALSDGTESLSTDSLAERFESVGAQFSTDSVRDMGLISLRTLTEPDWMTVAVETLGELLAAPAFPEEAMERRRRQQLRALLGEQQDPGSTATRRFYELLYAGHPYANPVRGTAESVPTLTREEVIGFYQTYYTAQNAVLALTGAITRAQAEVLAEHLSAALPQGARAPALPPVPPLEEAITERVRFPADQAHIFIGMPLLRRDDPDHEAFTIMNHVFGGGGFTSRLFQVVRNERGLAYSVYSSVQPMAAEGPFLMGLQTGVEQIEEALEILMRELQQFHEEGPTPDEWAKSVANITGGFPMRLASNGDIVRNLGSIGFYDLPSDYLSGYIQRIQSVEPEMAHERFHARIDPSRLVTIVVGGEI